MTYAIELRRILDDLKQTQQQQLQMKNQFLSHISHEFRTQLTASQICYDSVRWAAGDLKPEQHEYLKIALKNIIKLRNMINKLLNLTRADT